METGTNDPAGSLIIFILSCCQLSGWSFFLRTGLTSRRPKQTHQILETAKNLEEVKQVVSFISMDQSQSLWSRLPHWGSCYQVESKWPERCSDWLRPVDTWLE